jgi:hypothetical protein
MKPKKKKKKAPAHPVTFTDEILDPAYSIVPSTSEAIKLEKEELKRQKARGSREAA